MEIVETIKLIGGVVLLILGMLGLGKYGKYRENKGAIKKEKEIMEAVDEGFIDLADDVLYRGHPYSVSDSPIAEIASSRDEAEGGMVTDVQREGGDGGSGRNGSTSS